MNINNRSAAWFRLSCCKISWKEVLAGVGWRCPKVPLDLFQFQKMDAFFFFFFFFPILYHMENALGGNPMSSCMHKMYGAWWESNLCSPWLHITSGIIKEKTHSIRFWKQNPSGIRMVICIHTRRVSTFQKPAPNPEPGQFFNYSFFQIPRLGCSSMIKYPPNICTKPPPVH